METIINTINLTKTYNASFKKPKIEALKNLSVEIHNKEIVALLGLNGAGKTTFIKLILGLTYATNGMGYVFNNHFGSDNIKKRIGYLPENHNIPPFMTGYRALLTFGKLFGLSGKILLSRVEELLELVGLIHAKDLKVSKYSKGMKQRLALAYSLLHNPDLLLLDEPTDGLDPIARKEVRKLLLFLKDSGKTIFINSHLLSEIELICDKALILKKGVLIAEGNLKDICSSDSFYKIITKENCDNLSFNNLSVSAIGNTVSIQKKNEELLNNVIDIIRKQNITILSVGEDYVSLEEQFINLVSK